MYVIGIDGGGTKTTGVITDHSGKIFKEVTVGGTNLNSKDRSDVIFELVTLINKLKKDTDVIFAQVTSVFAGMSGAGNRQNQQDLHNIIVSLFPTNVVVIIDNDAITALYSGTLGEPGIVQIAGTGAITYGINKDGERGRVGGWGHYFSDFGSGYSIGRDGLRASFMAYDNMGQETEIIAMLLSHFKVNDIPDLVNEVYQHDNPKEIIASLSRIVADAADQGDQVALAIVDENATYLGQAIATLAEKLFPISSHSESLPVVLAGGLFNRFDLFEKPINNTLLHNRVNVELIIPSISPVGGAVVAALMSEKIKINDDFIAHFNQK